MPALQDRPWWLYFALFFSGSLSLIYESMAWNFLGESIGFMATLLFLLAFTAKRWVHLVENSALLSVGYILPLTLRNLLRDQTAPLQSDFWLQFVVSLLTVFIVGVVAQVPVTFVKIKLARIN